ncbi:MAG: NUDIX hydrolase [Caldilineaceae bacterium]
MQPWKTIERSTVLRVGDGRRLTVENHVVGLPDGTVIDDWSFVHTPDYVNIVAATPTDEFLIFRQTKYAVKGITLAIPGGYIEPNENPLLAAQRELLEETGYSAAEWIDLGVYAVDGNRGCGNGHLFFARHATWQQPIDADDLEEQEFLLLPRVDVIAALSRGDFKVLSWTTAVALALLHDR